jgi:hypothetical protein
MEACATAHHWARELEAQGHQVKLMPPAYVKAYVKRNKNDAADAEAICEAVTRPTMRFVAVKSANAQSILMLHRARHLLVRQRTAQVSALRAHLAEYGIVAPKGRAHVRELVAVLDKGESLLPELARQTLLLIAGMIEGLSTQIRKIEIELMAWHRGTRYAGDSRRSPASASSPPLRWSPRSVMPRCSAPAGSSLPGSGWCPSSTRPVARSEWAGYRKWETAICDTSSLSAQRPSSAIHGARPPLSASGRTSFWSASLPGWSRSPSPTRWLESPGRSWPVRKTTAPRQPKPEADRRTADITSLGRRERHA